jgi:hypothetical protein
MVRSQVHIKSTHYGYETDRDFSSVPDENEMYKSLGIPIPQKVAMSKKVFEAPNFKRINITGLEIKDKIRNVTYIFEKSEEGKKLTIKSILGFIEVQVFISEKVTNRIYKEWKQKLKSTHDSRKLSFPFTGTRKWIQHAVNILETSVFLDEIFLKLIAEFIDENIIEEPTERNLVELDLLVSSTIAFPKSSSDEFRRFNTEQAILFSEMSPNLRILSKDLMVYFLTNQEKSILYSYKEMDINQSFNEFLFVMSHLVYEGFLKINKLEFV